MAPLSLLLNGERREVPPGTTVASLLELIGVGAGQAAVERNGEVVPRAQHAHTVLEQGDNIEVVTFVGGG